MKLVCEDSHGVSVETAFAALADFDALEDLARSYGAEVERLDDDEAQGGARCWRLTVGFRGNARSVTARVSEMTPPQGYVITAQADGVVVDLRLTLVALGADRCTVCYTAEISARTLGARMLVQPLRLAHKALEAKFQGRISAFVQARLAA